MSHEVENMFYVGERPWHGLGTHFENAPTIEEGIIAAGLDWEVELEDLTTVSGLKLEKHKAIMRKDTDTCLGVLTNAYKPLQNSEAFNFFEPFIDNGLASLETAGCLMNGKKVFVLAKINSDNIQVSEEDQIEKYILLSNSHDGSQALKVGFTAIRVVCNNTLTMAETSDASQLIRVYHKGNVVESLQELQEAMDLVNQQFAMSEEKYRYLATKNVSVTDLERYVKNIFSTKSIEAIINNHAKEVEQEEVENTRKRLLARVEEIFELEPVHNAWTMYNSVNYYLNHDSGRSLDGRYNSLWFGNNKRVDKKAFELALTY